MPEPTPDTCDDCPECRDSDNWTVCCAACHCSPVEARCADCQPAPEPAPVVTVRPTTYTVSVLPGRNLNSYLYEITVEERGQLDDRTLWAVCRMKRCLDADGVWDWEPIPSGREDDWLTAHRFDLGTALRLAKAAAPLVEVNGCTAADVLATTRKEIKP